MIMHSLGQNRPSPNGFNWLARQLALRSSARKLKITPGTECCEVKCIRRYRPRAYPVSGVHSGDAGSLLETPANKQIVVNFEIPNRHAQENASQVAECALGDPVPCISVSLSAALR